MIEVPDQLDWNPVLTDAGFVTVNMPCFFTYETSPTDINIHFTTNAQIYGTAGQTLYIKNPQPKDDTLKLAYAKANN
jgi:hypothetical protein